MARKPTPTVVVDSHAIAEGPGPLTPGLVAVRDEHDTVQANVLTLAEQIGYDGSLTIGALDDGLRYFKHRTVEDMLEMGKRLVLMKEMVPHGEFLLRLQVHDIHVRAAQRFMSATLRFSKATTSSLLKRIDGESKLLELMVLDDDELDTLSAGGSAAGITLDEVETMSVRELRAALREARDNEQAMGRVLQEKNAKLDKLAADATKAPQVTEMWDARLIGVSDEINKLGVVADEIFGKHVSFIDVCQVVADKLDPDEPDYRDKLEQARVPIARLGDQIERFAHIVARLRFDFDTRLGFYQDKTHILTPEDAE